MIQFLFFPFTHMTRIQLNTVLAFFSSFQYFPGLMGLTHHQALQEAFEQGKIHPVFSSPEDLATVDQKLSQYQAWVQIHKGNETNLKLLLKDNPYFTSDTDVIRIKSQIKGAKDGKERDIVDVALLDDFSWQHNLLFLKMAHLCDEQNEQIDLALKKLETNRDKLMLTLCGLESPLSEEDSMAGDSKDLGAMMTRERIHAWSGCMAQKGVLIQEEGRQPLFITTSEAVFEYLESNCQDSINTLDIDKIKVHENECENKSEWQHHFCENLMRAIQGNGIQKNDIPEVNDRCSFLGQIKLSLFSGKKINDLFNYSGKQIPVCLIKLK